MFSLRLFDQTAQQPRKFRLLPTLLKAVVSLGLLAFLFQRVQLESVWRELSAARLDFMLGAELLFLALQFTVVFRWRALSRTMGFDRTTAQYAHYYFIGLFFNLFLPSAVGGDAARCYYLAGDRSRILSALVTLMADRGIGMVALMLIASLAILLARQVAIPFVLAAFIWGLTAFLVIAILLPFIVPSLFRRRGFPIEYWERPGVLSWAMILSLVNQIGLAVVNILIGGALDLHIPMGYYFIFTPLVIASTMLPISLNGLGIREGAFVFFLIQAGVPEATGLAFSLLLLSVIVIAGLAGGLVWILAPASPAKVLKT